MELMRRKSEDRWMKVWQGRAAIQRTSQAPLRANELRYLQRGTRDRQQAIKDAHRNDDPLQNRTQHTN